MSSHLLLAAVLMLSVYSQLMIKSRALLHGAKMGGSSDYLHYLVSMLMDIPVLSGAFATFLAGVCWILAMERVQLGYAYPFMALHFVLVPAGSAVLFGEPLPPYQLVGIGLIVIGVGVSALGR